LSEAAKKKESLKVAGAESPRSEKKPMRKKEFSYNSVEKCIKVLGKKGERARGDVTSWGGGGRKPFRREAGIGCICAVEEKIQTSADGRRCYRKRKDHQQHDGKKKTRIFGPVRKRRTNGGDHLEHAPVS